MITADGDDGLPLCQHAPRRETTAGSRMFAGRASSTTVSILHPPRLHFPQGQPAPVDPGVRAEAARTRASTMVPRTVLRTKCAIHPSRPRSSRGRRQHFAPSEARAPYDFAAPHRHCRSRRLIMSSPSNLVVGRRRGRQAPRGPMKPDTQRPAISRAPRSRPAEAVEWREKAPARARLPLPSCASLGAA